MRPLVMLCALPALLVSACSQPSPDAAVSTAAPAAPAAELAPAVEPEPPPAPPACSGLDQEACEAAEGCSTIRGLSAEDLAQLQRPDPAFSGVPGSILGCTSSEQGCKEVETMAAAAAGETCYLFGDSCVPEGWVPCKMKIAVD